MEDTIRKFRGVWIPKEIWENDSLSLAEKVLLVEIDSLAGDDVCYASNNYFANFFKLSPSRISHIINNLKKNNWINISYETEGKQIVKRYITINKPPYPDVLRICNRGIADTQKGYCGNSEDININTNNIYFSDTKLNEVFNEWLSYKKERKSSYQKSGLDKLISRINRELENHSVDDLVNVINESMENNYQGITFNKLKQIPNKPKKIERNYL